MNSHKNIKGKALFLLSQMPHKSHVGKNLKIWFLQSLIQGNKLSSTETPS